MDKQIQMISKMKITKMHRILNSPTFMLMILEFLQFQNQIEIKKVNISPTLFKFLLSVMVEKIYLQAVEMLMISLKRKTWRMKVLNSKMKICIGAILFLSRILNRN